MSETSDIIKIPDLARILDMTEAGVRGHIQRRTDAIPPWFQLGSRIVWRRKAVEEWLKEREQTALADRVVRPTRRRSGGSRSSTRSASYRRGS